MSEDKDLVKERFQEIQEYLKIAGSDRSWIATAFTICLIILIFVALYYFTTDAEPLLSHVTSISSTTTSTTDTVQVVENSYYILGAHDNKLYSYHKGTGHLYVYDISAGTEAQGIELRNMTPTSWHESGKAIFISEIDKELNSAYLIDVSTQTITQTTLIDRQQNVKVSSNLQIDESSLVAWSTDGGHIAFTLFDVDTHRQWLFIFVAGSQPALIFTPAQEMDKLSSLTWVNQTLYFVAVKDGVEGRYQIDNTGGNFKMLSKK